jgi:hypothetical protein
MKIVTTIIVSSFVFMVAPTKIDPKSIIETQTNRSNVTSQAKKIAQVLTDAQSLRDLESVIINMPQTGSITPASVLALIESHRNTNRDYYEKGLYSSNTMKDNSIYKMLIERQQVLLDANKAIKKAEYLQEEVNRLRKKIQDKK